MSNVSGLALGIVLNKMIVQGQGRGEDEIDLNGAVNWPA